MHLILAYHTMQGFEHMQKQERNGEDSELFMCVCLRARVCMCVCGCARACVRARAYMFAGMTLSTKGD